MVQYLTWSQGAGMVSSYLGEGAAGRTQPGNPDSQLEPAVGQESTANSALLRRHCSLPGSYC